LVRNPGHLEELGLSATKTSDLHPALFLLGTGDTREIARAVSCAQAIASDSCFSLGMLARFKPNLEEFGPSFYKALYWEAGLVGQCLYLHAEQCGFRGTGIGCFLDDEMHNVLGVTNESYQVLYHFTVGVPRVDERLV
jgi:hypothetical protein